MKIKIDVDCTPQEARAFLGLPDVAPMQKAMMVNMPMITAVNAAMITVMTMTAMQWRRTTRQAMGRVTERRTPPNRSSPAIGIRSASSASCG